LLERHEQVHVKRQIRNAQALENFLQRLAPDEFGRALGIGYAQPEEQLDNCVKAAAEHAPQFGLTLVQNGARKPA
tara:strand:+ start:826 stop:1050 length:225 start_codon:yes stop_codon:yes gene_type:complete